MIKKVYAIVYDCPGLLQFGEVLVYNVNIYKQEHLFGNAIDFVLELYYYLLKEFRTSVLAGNGGLHMNEQDYKKLIIECVESIKNINVLEYLYTFIKKFVKKWG